MLNGTSGQSASAFRPTKYNGICGPGTFVHTMFSIDGAFGVRGPAKACIRGGTWSAIRDITAKPPAWFASLSRFIPVTTARCRSPGSVMPTGNGAMNIDTWFPSADLSFSVRTFTGTIARNSTPSVAWP